MKAYAYIEDGTSRDEPHDSGVAKSMKDLEERGVFYHKFSGPTAEQDLDKLAEERKYTNRDEIELSEELLGEKFKELSEMFFREHMHDDEEIRYILSGSGYFDIRDKDDTWIRIHAEKDDMLIIPPNLHHRFTLDTGRYIKSKRLFKDNPSWAAIFRPEADIPASPITQRSAQAAT